MFKSSVPKKEKKIKMNKIQKITEVKKLQLVFDMYCNRLKALHFSKVKLLRIKECGTFMTFLTNEERTHHKLHRGNFCGDRMCPVCSYRNARKQAYQVLELVSYAKTNYDYKYIFLTLTAPNVEGDQLSGEIDAFQDSFRRLQNLKEFKVINKGFIRKLEVTYNEKENTYHPHYHVLIAVNKSYFASKAYLSQKRWLELWKESKRDDSIKIVDVRPAKVENVKEIFELTKYATKHKDLLQNEEIFKILYDSFKNRRILTFNGIFKELKRLQTEKKLDLSTCSELEDLKVILDREIYYHWKEGQYEEGKEIQLSHEDLEQIYNLDFDEMD